MAERFGNTGDHIPGPVVIALQTELDHINRLVDPSNLRVDDVDHGISGQLVILSAYLRSAEDYWVFNRDKSKALASMRKLAATAIRAMILYGDDK